MTVIVWLFASYRETAGTSRAVFSLAPGATVGELAAAVVQRFPSLPECERLIVAVNSEYQDHDFVLTDGDDVAFIPPVSGG